MSLRCLSLAILAGVIRFFFGPRFLGCCWLVFSSSNSSSGISVMKLLCCVATFCTSSRDPAAVVSSSSEVLNVEQQLDDTTSLHSHASDDVLLSIGITSLITSPITCLITWFCSLFIDKHQTQHISVNVNDKLGNAVAQGNDIYKQNISRSVDS